LAIYYLSYDPEREEKGLLALLQTLFPGKGGEERRTSLPPQSKGGSDDDFSLPRRERGGKCSRSFRGGRGDISYLRRRKGKKKERLEQFIWTHFKKEAVPIFPFMVPKRMKCTTGREEWFRILTSSLLSQAWRRERERNGSR